MGLVEHEVQPDALTVVADFRSELYACLTARSDALLEPSDTLLCTDGPVRILVDLALTLEHRRGHGTLYSGNNHGRIHVARLEEPTTRHALRRRTGTRRWRVLHPIRPLARNQAPTHWRDDPSDPNPGREAVHGSGILTP